MSSDQGDSQTDEQDSDTSSQPGDDDFDAEDLALEDGMSSKGIEEDDAEFSGSPRSNEDGEEAGTDIERDDGGRASTSGQDKAQQGDRDMAAAFAEILSHPGPVNLKNKAPILLVLLPQDITD